MRDGESIISTKDLDIDMSSCDVSDTCCTYKIPTGTAVA